MSAVRDLPGLSNMNEGTAVDPALPSVQADWCGAGFTEARGWVRCLSVAQRDVDSPDVAGKLAPARPHGLAPVPSGRVTRGGRHDSRPRLAERGVVAAPNEA